MPRATHPLTPASSTDIKGQDGSKQLASLQMSFELPPPAMHTSALAASAATETRTSPSATTDRRTCGQSPTKPAYPLQASEAVKSRRRSSATAAAAAAKESFALPPPPTRSRKIIQMKPRPQEEVEAQAAGSGVKSGAKSTTASSSSAAAPAGASGLPAAKKKQPSATSAAGRKIARKTAHSLIERRRRSKMNEEFATLKNMVPACTGEMHKLAILQASIEYVRYLEDCVSKLKAQRENPDPTTPTELGPPPSAPYDGGYQAQSYEASVDVDMTDSELPSPAFPASNPPTSQSNQSSVSPALLAEDSRRRNSSYSSVSTAAVAAADGSNSGSSNRHYSFASSTTSPAFGPQVYSAGGYSHPGSTLTSPALPPQRDLDHEATAALLMLNNDRRGTSGSASARGMSVRDLLST